MILIEAFARKTPVLVPNLGALPDVVHESGGGLVYHDDEELVSSLRRLADAPALRADLGEHGYQAFLHSWTREAHLAQYFTILAELAQRKYGSVPWMSVSQ